MCCSRNIKKYNIQREMQEAIQTKDLQTYLETERQLRVMVWGEQATKGAC